MSALDRFLDWWGGELRAMFRLGTLMDRRDTLIAILHGQRVSLQLRRRGKTQDLGNPDAMSARETSRLSRRVQAGRLHMSLLLPDDQVIRQNLTLPVAAKGDLANVLRFEIERVTPFKVAEIYFSHLTAPGTPSEDRVAVDLLFAPRAAIDPVLARLDAAGLPVTIVDVADAQGTPMGRNLLAEAAPAKGSIGQRITGGLVILALALAAVLGWTLLQMQNARIDDLQQALQRERRAVIEAQDANLPVSGKETARVAAYQRRTAAPMAVAILDDLAKALPDGTWVESLSLQGSALEFSGTSSDATALIGLFERHARFEAPSFKTSITRTRDGTGERFVLGLTIRQGEASE